MAWVKVDDQFFRHPKVLAAGRDARDLYLVGLCYCAQSLTDGFIPDAAIRVLAAEAEIDTGIASAARLIGVGLWEVVEGGYIVHDYLEYQPSKEKVVETREARAEAGRRGGKQKASNLLDKNLANEKQNSTPYPSRTHPVPVPLPDPQPDPSQERAVRAAPKRTDVRPTLPSADELISQLHSWAEERGVRDILADEVDRFRDYCLSGKNGKPVTYADYAAACRKWITNPSYGHTARAPTQLVVNGSPIPANSRTARNIRMLDTPWPEHHRQEER